MTVRTTPAPDASCAALPDGTHRIPGETPAPTGQPPHLRAVWLALTVVTALLLATVAALLASVDGNSLARSLGIGGAAFVAVTGVILGALRFLTESAR